MKFTKSAGLVVLCFLFSTAVLAGVPNLINYQGRLTNTAGNPVTDSTYSVTFTIYDAPASGNNLWSEMHSVATNDGQFLVKLGTFVSLTENVFTDSIRYIGVQINPDPEITPRQRLVSVPFSFHVSTVDGASGGTITSKVSIGPGHTNTGLHAFIAGENNTASGDYTTVDGGANNLADDTASTVGGGRNNKARGMYSVVSGGGGIIAADSNSALGDWCVVGGGFANTASGAAATVGGGGGNTASVFYATVGGGAGNTASGGYATVGGGLTNVASGGGGSTVSGGQDNEASGFISTIGGGVHNDATDEHATIAGGVANTASGFEASVGGGGFNTASGVGATVGGGVQNTASGTTAWVGGGAGDTASGDYAVVGGGSHNVASGLETTVGGGGLNVSGGTYATIPGGYSNRANGQSSFAAGRYAHADHDGTFVWSNGLPSFTSTGVDQFLIKAPGGVGIGTNSPTSATGGQVLHVNNASGPSALRLGNGAVNGKQWEIQSTVTGGEGVLNVIDVTDGANYMTILESGYVGFGEPNPSKPIEMASGAHVTAGGTWTNASSRDYKTDIESFTEKEYSEILKKLEDLDVVHFKYKSEPDVDHIGMIAEDVPNEIASPDRKGIPTADAIAFLVAAVKAQQNQIEELKLTIQQLKDRHNEK